LVSDVSVSRAIAVGAGVVALAAGWAEATYEPDHGLWFGFGVRVAPSAVLLVAIINLAILQLRRSSTTVAFVVDAGNHVFRTRPVAAAIWWPAIIAIVFSANFGSFASTTGEPGSDPEWQLAVVEVAGTAFLGLLTTATMSIWLYSLWSGRPAVELTPVGVRVLAPLGSLAVPWEGLAPGYPLQPKRRADTLTLTVAQENLARRRGIAMLALGWLDIHPWFLADAIRYYVAHPEHRAAIGTAEEHDRLRHLLSGETTLQRA
jgi:hypothetical protein